MLNLFRMAGLMSGDRIKTESSGAAGVDGILQAGPRAVADIDALATRAGRQIAVLAWNYHDDELPAAPAAVHLALAGIPQQGAVLVQHYRIDDTHSNSYTVWKEMGSPAAPSPEQYARLEAAGQLQLLSSPDWVAVKDSALSLHFDLPRHAVSLLRVEW